MLGINADALGIIVNGLNGRLVRAGLLDQQVAGGTIFFFLTERIEERGGTINIWRLNRLSTAAPREQHLHDAE